MSFQSMKLSILTQAVLVFTLALIANVVVQSVKYPPRLPYADEFLYLDHAYSIYADGVFGSSVFPKGPGQGAIPEAFGDPAGSSRYMMPLYPAFVAGLMSIDSQFKNAVICSLENYTGMSTSRCDPEYGSAIFLQAVIMSLVIPFAWLSVYAISGSSRTAWLAAVLLIASKQYFYFPNYFLTEVLYLPLVALHGWCIIKAWQDGGVGWFLAAGLAIGLAALTRPGWELAAAALAILMFLLMLFRTSRERLRGLFAVSVFCLGVAVVLGGWSARNLEKFGSPALIDPDYGVYALSQRLAYNTLSWTEIGAAFVYWLPDFGDKLATAVLERDSYIRLDFESKETLYFSPTYGKIRREAEDEDDPISYLISEKILDNLGKHIAVTFAFVWRGMWISGNWGLVGWILALPALVPAITRRRWDVTVFVFTPLFILGLNGFVSLGLSRYNLALAPALACGAALTLNSLANWAKKRWRRR